MPRRIGRSCSDAVALSMFKATVPDQFTMLLLDTEAALAAIPPMLPADHETRVEAFSLIEEVLGARGTFSAEEQARLRRVAGLFGLDEKSSVARNLAIVPSSGKDLGAKAS